MTDNEKRATVAIMTKVWKQAKADTSIEKFASGLESRLITKLEKKAEHGDLEDRVSSMSGRSALGGMALGGVLATNLITGKSISGRIASSILNVLKRRSPHAGLGLQASKLLGTAAREPVVARGVGQLADLAPAIALLPSQKELKGITRDHGK